MPISLHRSRQSYNEKCLGSNRAGSVQLPTRFKDPYESLLAARDRAVANNAQASKVELVPLKEEIDRLLSEFIADQQNSPAGGATNASQPVQITPLTARVGAGASRDLGQHLRPTNPRVSSWADQHETEKIVLVNSEIEARNAIEGGRAKLRDRLEVLLQELHTGPQVPVAAPTGTSAPVRRNAVAG